MSLIEIFHQIPPRSLTELWAQECFLWGKISIYEINFNINARIWRAWKHKRLSGFFHVSPATPDVSKHHLQRLGAGIQIPKPQTTSGAAAESFSTFQKQFRTSPRFLPVVCVSSWTPFLCKAPKMFLVFKKKIPFLKAEWVQSSYVVMVMEMMSRLLCENS